MSRTVSKLIAWKWALAARGRWGRRLVPVLEFAEVWLTHGPKEVATRVRRRIGPRVLEPPAGYAPPPARVETVPRLTIPPLQSDGGTSIVIPVLNQAAVTYSCLAAIVKHTPAGCYDVIAVDNGSDPNTQAMLAKIDGLRCIRNETNVGFVDACNQGAASAAGKYILFLNNDTTVLPGWLDALMGTFQSHPNAGAVGAKLVYPDGRLQEAGSIVWQDGSAWNYGKQDNPHAPEFSYVREVDYCSAACLLVERQAWQELGGFDSRYSPAYYEDTDFCFRLRENGRAVYYQPGAEVVHLEGATAGTDESIGFKSYQRRNRDRFVERHDRALKRQHPPDPRLLRRARDRRTGQRILIVDDMVPQHDRNSGSVRATAILRILVELGHSVTFLPDNLARVEPYTSALQQLGIEVLYGPMAPVKWVTDHVQEFDTVILCRASFAAKYLPAVRSARRPPFLIFDTVDLHYLREERRAEIEDSDQLRQTASRTREVELEVMNGSDMIWVTSTHEAEVLARVPEARRVEIVPNIHETAVDVPGFEGRLGALFIGGFRHPPNEDAIVYFVNEVLPLVRQRLPDVHLHIVGSDMPATVFALASPHVTAHGFVEDVTPLFNRCRLSVAPLRYGAGVKGKVSQSLALGLPVVTTPIGAEGMQLRHGEHAMVGVTASELAHYVVQIHENKDLWTRLSQQGRQHARQTQGYEMARDRIREILNRA
jgi:GT2 family glycosyltransferase